MTEPTQLVTIVIADDDIADRLAIRRTLIQGGLCNPILEVGDGQQLLDLVHGAGADPDAPSPGLILLDLNMPTVDGREVLARMADDETLSAIPVVVLTGSDEPDDIRRSYLAGVVSYVAKPVSFNEIRRVISELDGYGLGIVKRG